ncbi:porin [Azospirillum sp. ST 5-10]|uniref:porin n=1 Tax=unclassified Azospirillum TaxID=2630922 RepID=UPI003F49ECD5
MRHRIATGAAALLTAAASPALAETTVKLGGYVQFQAGHFAYDDRDGENDAEFRNEVEIHVRADGKADNGLEYGVKIELETGGTVIDGDGRTIRTDEANIYLAGAWGRVELGDDDGAAEVLVVRAPTPSATITDMTDDWGLPVELDEFFGVPDSSDSTKVTYLSPDLYGFKAGVSFAPETNEGDAVYLTAPRDRYGDWVEGGVRYETAFGDVTVAATATVSAAQADGNELDDFVAWQTGVEIAYAGLTVGGGYVSFGDFTGSFTLSRASLDTLDGEGDDGWNLGAMYEAGDVEFAVTYAEVSFDAPPAAGNGDFDFTALTVEAGYALAPGLSIHGGYVRFRTDAGQRGTFDDDLFLVGTRLTF